MASNMRTSRAGLDVIKAFEGFRPRYQQLPDGRWIIGYGHVRETREGVRVNPDEAEAILREYDLPPIERLVMDSILAPLNQNEFDALVSLAYNLGAKAFVSCDVVAHINAGNRLAAAGAFDAWRRAKIGGRVQIIDALVRRRASEKALFLTAPGQMPVASSRIYFPLHDTVKLPPPPKPREIVVERAPDMPRVDAPPMPEPSRIATEDAAESVKRRLVRIIGEDGNRVSKKTDTMTDGASPEEITAAISALAGESEKSGVGKSVWPPREDLPPPPHLDEDDDDTPILQPAPDASRIDDLEEVEISPDDIQRAVANNRSMEAEETGEAGLDALPFGLLSLIGAGLAGYGLASQFGAVESNGAEPSELAVYLPPFLMLLGGLLFVVMAYYFFRALFESD